MPRGLSVTVWIYLNVIATPSKTIWCPTSTLSAPRTDLVRKSSQGPGLLSNTSWSKTQVPWKRGEKPKNQSLIDVIMSLKPILQCFIILAIKAGKYSFIILSMSVVFNLLESYAPLRISGKL